MYFSSDKYKTANCKLGNRLLLLLIIVFSVLSSTAQNINKPNKMGPMGTQVNTKTGNLYIARNDIHVPARGFDLDISFGYNSYNFEQNSGFGNGWSFGYSIKYTNDTANSKTISWGDGREDNYKQLSGGVYQSPKGYFNTFTQYQPNKYLLTELNGTKFYFDNSTHKRITKMEEPNGNYINFNYTDTLLASLVNTAGQSISFTYNGLGNLATVVDAIAAPTRIYTYTYDGNNNLTQVTDPLGGTYKYSFLVNGPMKTMTDKNNNAIDIIYFSDFSISEIIGCNKRISFSYDTSTNITMVTDHLTTGDNQVTKYGFKKSGDQVWLNSISGNCCGYNLSFEFDDNGNKIKETDANGNVYTFTYDTRGNVLTTTNPLNQTYQYTYTPIFNNIASVKDPKGYVTTMNYDSRGNLVQLIEPGNLEYTTIYNDQGILLSSTDSKGNVYSYTYDINGNLTNVKGPNGVSGTFSYNGRGDVINVTDSRGNSNVIQYDILSRVKKVTDPLNASIEKTYDAGGNVIQFKNKNNEASLLKYDASNRLVSFEDVLGKKSMLGYDAMDNLATITNAEGNTDNMEYDNLNRISRLTNALDENAKFSYDNKGNLTNILLPNGQQLNYSYDQLDRVTHITDLKSTIAEFGYDRNGNLINYKNATNALTTAEYDSLNRIRKTTDPLGNSVKLTYDEKSNITSITNRDGHTSLFTYDANDRVRTVTDHIGGEINIGYDTEGNVTSLKDHNNNTTTYLYDNLNRVARTTYPDGKYLAYFYDNKGNMIIRQLTDGTSIHYQYDSLRRITGKSLPDGQLFTYTYDGIGRVRTATNQAGTVTFEYDALNRIISESLNGRQVRYVYNTGSRIQNTVYPDGTVIIKTFDERNRLVSIAENNNLLISYQYNQANQVISKSLGNGIMINYQYDFSNRLTSINAANGSIQNTTFTYDKQQNKTTINRLNAPSKSEQFAYDNAYRLTQYKRGTINGTSLLQNSYNYDALGNRISANLNGTNISYNSNQLNQLTSYNNGAQTTLYTYDNNGNVTFDGKFHKSYDPEGRLMKDSASPGMVMKYQYDAVGRKVRKIMNGQVTDYSFAGIAAIEERNGNSILNKTVFSNFITPITNEKDGKKYFYLQNEMNSVEAITNFQGQLVEKYEYDIYGKLSRLDSLDNPLAASPSGNRFAYTGQVYDSASGNYHYFFRQYNPETGLFQQRDLIGYADGMGMYQYVGNNPANGVDIYGLEQDIDVKDPCAHDKNKVRFITNKMIEAEREGMLDDANKMDVMRVNILGNPFTGNSWLEYDSKALAKIQAGWSADSKFYSKWTKYHGSENFYFKGQVMKNYVVNYYFTSYVLASKNFSYGTADALVDTWDYGKGAKDAAFALIQMKNPFSAFGKRMSEHDVKNSNAMDAYTDYQLKMEKNYDIKRNKDISSNYEYKKTDFGEWWPVINPETGELGYEFFPVTTIKAEQYKDYIKDIKKNCPQNGGRGGTQKPKPNGPGSGGGAGGAGGGATTKTILAIGPKDPNAIIGPDGEPTKRWVSVKDRLPYTILYENDKTASAPAKFVRVTTSIEPKQDAATFQLGNFGFNNQTFTVPPATAAYYQRLDCIDSLGLFVDITAGYDQIKKVAFWEFQSIDPVTLLPPADPFKGFVLQQDSLHPNYGHGFVNFTIKPIQTAVTLDTIGARAAIVFDFNDTIPTNIANNTIDAYAPTSYMNPLPPAGNNTVDLSWGGMDDTGGCGLKYYTLYVSKDGVNFNIIRNGITRTDTSFTGAPNTTFYFFVLATDSVGNTETLRPGEVKSVYFGAGALPVTWLYFRGVTQGKDNLLEWATATEQNSKEFKVERSLNGTAFTSIGTLAAAGNSTMVTSYQFKDYNIDRLNSGVMFYRLKQFDKNGAYHYSNIVRLNYNQKENTKSIVYPNPTQGLITVTIGDKALIGTTAAVYDENGKLLEAIKITGNSQTFNMGKYVNGTYFIKLSNKEVLRVVRL